MKLKDEQLNWIYQNIDELKRSLVALDYAMGNRKCDSEYRHSIEDHILDLALSFLMVTMGDNIPKTYWQVDDYSVLYGVLDTHKDDGGMNLRDYD